MKLLGIAVNLASTVQFKSQRVALLKKVEGKNMLAVVSEFASCRGWMSDLIHEIKTNPEGRGAAIAKYDIYKDHTYIGITFMNREMKDTFLHNFNVLHSKEGLACVRKSAIYKTSEDLVLVIKGSKYWHDSCWKIQLYTFYLRCMCYKDLDYYRSTWDGLNRGSNEIAMLSNVRHNKEVFTSVTSIHGQTGPDAICNSQNPDMAALLGVNS